MRNSGFVGFVGFKGNLQHSVSQAIAIEAGDGHGCLIVVGHGDEAESLALVGVEVTDDLDVVHCAKGAKELPEDTLIRIRGQVIDEDAPACPCVTRDVHSHKTCHPVNGDWGEPLYAIGHIKQIVQPESLSLVVERARVSPVGGLVQLGEQGLAGLLAGVVGKLHSNRFCSTLGFWPFSPLMASSASILYQSG